MLLRDTDFLFYFFLIVSGLSRVGTLLPCYLVNLLLCYLVTLILIFSRATVRNPTYLDTTDIAHCIIPYSRKSYNQFRYNNLAYKVIHS